MRQKRVQQRMDTLIKQRILLQFVSLISLIIQPFGFKTIDKLN